MLLLLLAWVFVSVAVIAIVCAFLALAADNFSEVVGAVAIIAVVAALAWSLVYLSTHKWASPWERAPIAAAEAG